MTTRSAHHRAADRASLSRRVPTPHDLTPLVPRRFASKGAVT